MCTWVCVCVECVCAHVHVYACLCECMHVSKLQQFLKLSYTHSLFTTQSNHTASLIPSLWHMFWGELDKIKLNETGRQESHTYRLTTTKSFNPMTTTDLFCQDRSRHSCKVKTGTRWSCHSRSVHQTPQLDTGTCSHSAEADMFHHAGMGCCHRPLTQTRSTHQRNPAIRTISFC